MVAGHETSEQLWHIQYYNSKLFFYPTVLLYYYNYEWIVNTEVFIPIIG